MSKWFENEGPLTDGWYIWKANYEDHFPEFIEIIDGAIMDYVPSDSFGMYYTIEEHTDYSGLWYGPLVIPE